MLRSVNPAFYVLVRSGSAAFCDPAFHCVLRFLRSAFRAFCHMLRSGILRSAAFCVPLRSVFPAFCVLLRSGICVLLCSAFCCVRVLLCSCSACSGILRSAAFCVLLCSCSVAFCILRSAVFVFWRVLDFRVLLCSCSAVFVFW